MAEKSRRVEITIAVIGLIGVIGAAIITNWDKLPFSRPSEHTQPNGTESPSGQTNNDQTPKDNQATTPAGFRIVEASLRADPFDHSGPCPVKINFSGRISAVGGGGTVSYRFLRSDGASAPIQTLTFDSPGSKDVNVTWTLGGPGFTFSGWESIKIIEPQESESNRATFKIQCQ